MGAADRADGGARLVAGEVRQALAIGGKQAEQLPDEPEAQLAIGRPVGLVEGAARGDDRGLDIGGRGVGRLADRRGGPRADDFEGAAAGGVSLAL